MNIFVYEFATGGGLGTDDTPDASAYLREGDAMLAALVKDLLALSGVNVSTLRDVRLPSADGLPRLQVHRVRTAAQQQTLFKRLAADADWTVLIAPELDGVLARLAALAENCDARLLGPASAEIPVLADKQRMAERLAGAGVATPQAVRLKPDERLPESFTYPAVIKPIDGAGSVDVQYVASFRDDVTSVHRVRRLERYCAGTPVSVSVLCGPARCLTLLPCGQTIIRRQRRMCYRGGWLPLAPSLAQRAAQLAGRACSAFHCRYGYIGIDIILGASFDGTDDVVVEVNPRLTTSYLGLRAAARQNLAGVMLELAAGRTPPVTFRSAFRLFDAGGIR